MPINWMELMLYVLSMLLVIGAATVMILFRLDLIKARMHQDMVDFQHAFLQGEYARIASEDSLARQELLTLIEEVKGVAQAVRGVCDERMASLTNAGHAH